MKNKIVNTLSKLQSIINHPELIEAKKKKMKIDFVKDLLFIKDSYQKDLKTIFDIGAADGQYSEAANFIFPNANIYAFEAIPKSFENMKKNIKSNKINAYNLVLDSFDGSTDFYINEFSYSSSTLKMTDTHKEEFPYTKNEVKVTLPTARLDSLKEINIEDPCLMKMDVQGAELNVLAGCGEMINKVDILQLEVNFETFYDGQAKYNEIFNFAFDKGFKRFIQTQPLLSDSKRILASDIIFFRD